MYYQDDLIHSHSTDRLFGLVNTPFYLSASFHELLFIAPKRDKAGGGEWGNPLSRPAGPSCSRF